MTQNALLCDKNAKETKNKLNIFSLLPTYLTFSQDIHNNVLYHFYIGKSCYLN